LISRIGKGDTLGAGEILPSVGVTGQRNQTITGGAKATDITAGNLAVLFADQLKQRRAKAGGLRLGEWYNVRRWGWGWGHGERQGSRLGGAGSTGGYAPVSQIRDRQGITTAQADVSTLGAHSGGEDDKITASGAKNLANMADPSHAEILKAGIGAQLNRYPVAT
jgi:hypothetical protein